VTYLYYNVHFRVPKFSVFSGGTNESIGKLKRAIRNARHISLLSSDSDIKSLIAVSEALLALHASVKIGVLSKMQICYDIAVNITSSADIYDDEDFILKKKLVKEVAGVRRCLLSIQMSSPVFSNPSIKMQHVGKFNAPSIALGQGN
jgi:hypothetical protein